MKLTRTEYTKNGIFGQLVDDRSSFRCQTLEHAYPEGGIYLPKVPSGQYVCARGEHQLAGMDQPFTTFEITNVPGHTNILFHVGNYNQDSEGCVLLGFKKDGDVMIADSKIAFEAFMASLDGVDSFNLVIE